MQFLTYSIGLNACRTCSKDALQQPKMTKVAVYLIEGGRVKLQAISGHNLAEKPGFHIMSDTQYGNLPTYPLERAKEMLALCGYEA